MLWRKLAGWDLKILNSMGAYSKTVSVGLILSKGLKIEQTYPPSGA
jgi:hypothetical protein